MSDRDGGPSSAGDGGAPVRTLGALLSPTSGSATAAGAAPGAKKLPKTGSAWPLLALASILSIAMGLTLTVRRRVIR